MNATHEQLKRMVQFEALFASAPEGVGRYAAQFLAASYPDLTAREVRSMPCIVGTSVITLTPGSTSVEQVTVPTTSVFYGINVMEQGGIWNGDCMISVTDHSKRLIVGAPNSPCPTDAFWAPDRGYKEMAPWVSYAQENIELTLKNESSATTYSLVVTFVGLGIYSGASILQ